MVWVNLSGLSSQGGTTKDVRQVHKDRQVLRSRSRKALKAIQRDMFELRPYQKDCISKMKWALGMDGNDLISLAQGGGKSVIIAHFAKDINQDILILQPSKELLSQNVDKLSRYVDKSEIGIYSASFNQKDIRKFTFGTIQSCYKNPELFTHFKVVIVDEADLWNPKNLAGMYNRFFKEMGSPKVYGLTGTPYRLDTIYEKYGYFIKSITTVKMINRYRDRIWDRMLYVMNTRELVEQKYLSPLTYFNKELIPIEKTPMNKSKSDYDLDKYSQMLDHNEVLDVVKQAQQRFKSIIVFCPTIASAEALNGTTKGGTVVSSTTPRKERDLAVSGFRTGKYQIAFNVGILTTGFDDPTIDCIILVRPTRSLRLYAQMIGRGTRIHPGKKDCAVIDLTGTSRVLGTLESIEVKRVPNERGVLQWNVVSSTNQGGWHYAKLYEHQIKKKVQEELF